MKGLGGKYPILPILFFWFYGRERERKVERAKLLSSIPRVPPTEFVEQRVKVHLLDDGYVWVPKRRGFTEDPREEVFLRPLSVLLCSKRSGFFLLWFIFHSKGCLVVFYALRGCLAVFFFFCFFFFFGPKGLFGKILGMRE